MSRLSEAESFSEALIEREGFKKELLDRNFHKVDIKPVVSENTSVSFFMAEYLNYISGNGTHAHLSKKLSPEHVAEYKKVFIRFCTAIKSKGINPEFLDVKSINDDVVEMFHFYIEGMGLSKTTYSKHFVLMKSFMNWVIEKKEQKTANCFMHITLKFAKREKNPIEKDEFEKLLSVTTPENGMIVDEKSGKRRNRFQSYLPSAFKLGLETGLRREELVMLSWNDIREINHQGKSCYIIDVNNLKNNRRMFGDDSGEFVKPVPVTKGLLKFLIELGLEDKKGSSDFILEREEGLDVKYMLGEISRGFSHFIKLVTKRKIEFKDLRKTYITQLSLKLGKETKLFTGHADDQVLKDSYIAEEYIAASLSDFSVFQN